MLRITKRIFASKDIRIFSVITLSFFFFYRLFPRFRTGDGGEYILLFESFTKTFRPWVSDESLKAYDLLFQSNQIPFMPPSSFIQQWFQSLVVENTFDVHHFWMYSALAALIHLIAKFFLLELSPSDSFIALHSLLFSVVTIVSWKKFKLEGVVTFILLVLCSPLFWYGNKIHTEFFTFCLVSLASMLVWHKSYTPAALALAFAATQNPSFSVIAIFLVLMRVLQSKHRVLTFTDLSIGLITFLTLAVHPAYYLWRQGVLTPTLITGGADLGVNSGHILVWFLDPDVGLFPNWPFGAFLLVFGLLKLMRNKSAISNSKHYLVFTLIFLAASLFAQSSTTNINSGGTPGLARYGLWYVGLFFPLLLSLVKNIRCNVVGLPQKVGILILATSLGFSIYSYIPLRPESYTSPTSLSRIIQTHFAKFYSPPIEVFVERYSDKGEEIPLITVGPDCRKIAITKQSNSMRVFSPSWCNLSNDKVLEYSSKILINSKQESYYTISEIEFQNFQAKYDALEYNFDSKSETSQLLVSGWSEAEIWGTWSDDTTAVLKLPCYIQDRIVKNALLRMGAFQNQRIEIVDAWGHKLLEANLNGPVEKELLISLAKQKCDVNFHTLKIHLPDAKSPSSLGISGDERQLGVSLFSLKLGN
jgi:hypothetical protein